MSMISDPEGADRRMNFAGHLRELRARLTISLAALAAGTALCAFFSKEILLWLMLPLQGALPEGSRFVALSPIEGWLTLFKVSVVSGVFLTSPIWAYHAWAFSAPALGREGRRRLAAAALVSAALFVSGGLACYSFVMPEAFGYFVGFLGGTGVMLMPQLSAFVGFMLKALIAFGLVSEVPLCVFLLVRWGIVSARAMAGARKYVIVGAFLTAAIVTPPDVLTQIALALPLIVLYELSMLAARLCRGPGGRTS